MRSQNEGTRHVGWKPVRPTPWFDRWPDLDAVEQASKTARRVIVTSDRSEFAGAGTASLVADFAERRGEEFACVLHLHADTAVQMTTQMAQLAYELDEHATPLRPSQAVRSLRAWLGERNDWLLVVYGVQHEHVLGSLLDLRGGTVLLACSPDSVSLRSDVSVVRLRPLEFDDLAAAFADAEEAGIEAARSVFDLVGRSPVGMATTHALRRHSGCDWRAMLASLEAVRLESHPDATGAERAVALALDGLARARPAEMKLLCALCSFTPSIVPVAVVERAASALGSTLVATDRSATELVDELASWNLVGRVERDGQPGVRVLAPVRRALWSSLPGSSRHRWHRRTVAFALRALFDERLDDLDVLPLGVCAARRTIATGVADESPVAAVVERLRLGGFRLAADELLADARNATGGREDPATRLARVRVEAESLLDRGEAGRAAAECDQALLVAEDAKASEAERDPPLEREIELLRLTSAVAHRTNGRQAEATAALTPLLDADETNPLSHLRALVELGEIEECRGRWSEALASLEQACALASRTEFDAPEQRLAAELAYCRLLVQRRSLDEAGGRLDAFSRDFVPRRVGAESLTELLRLHGEVRLRRGEFDAALATFDRARGSDTVAGESCRWAVALDRTGRAFVFQRRGAHEAAVTEFKVALQMLVEHSGVDAERIPRLLARLCWSLVETGDLEQARDYSRRAVRLRSRRPLPSNMDLVEILEARAFVLEVSGHPVDAVPLLRRAVAITDEITVAGATERRSLRLSLGRCLLASNQPADAVEPLETVVATAHSPDERSLLEQARDALETARRSSGENTRRELGEPIGEFETDPRDRESASHPDRLTG